MVAKNNEIQQTTHNKKVKCLCVCEYTITVYVSFKRINLINELLYTLFKIQFWARFHSKW